MPYGWPRCARRQMLSYAEGAVTKNASEKKINSLLDFMAGASDMNVSETVSNDK